tara:strand:+ start:81 stop:302 length:222 start_codon:yes stop_codon:yes gene_type:complete
MSYNKKPTMMEVKNVMSNIIMRMDMINDNLRAIDVTLGSYIEYKKDTKKFTSWLEKLNETTQKEIEEEKKGKK